MAIVVPCDRCGEELNEKGAILFSPPFDFHGHDACDKYHICVKCWKWLIEITEVKSTEISLDDPEKIV